MKNVIHKLTCSANFHKPKNGYYGLVGFKGIFSECARCGEAIYTMDALKPRWKSFKTEDLKSLKEV